MMAMNTGEAMMSMVLLLARDVDDVFLQDDKILVMSLYCQSTECRNNGPQMTGWIQYSHNDDKINVISLLPLQSNILPIFTIQAKPDPPQTAIAISITINGRHTGLEKGFQICNSNYAVIGLVIPFAALQAKFGPIKECSVVTLQALSGAGYPGVSSMDILDNVVPYISGEEDKLESEARKILGGVNGDATAFEEATDLKISGTCTRVAVLDDHTACVSLTSAKRPAPSDKDVKAALRDYVSEAQQLGCPSAPEHAIVIIDEPDRPQPRMDRETASGNAVSVGRVRKAEGKLLDFQFVVALKHNIIIGPAGSNVSNAKAAVLKSYCLGLLCEIGTIEKR
nr:putative aspartate-semialdehyde dehydrogenase [Quercus suber]